MQFVVLALGTVLTYLFKYLPAFLVYIMTFLGISLVTYTGVSGLLSGLESMILDAYGGLPATLIFVLKSANVDTAITILISFKVFMASIGAVGQFKNQYRVVHGGAP